jgi:hypothetical protein
VPSFSSAYIVSSASAEQQATTMIKNNEVPEIICMDYIVASSELSMVGFSSCQ